jgi:hypothetical protein
MPAPVEEELQLAAAACRKALTGPEFAGLDALMPGAPRNAEGWFELLSKYDKHREAVAELKRLKSVFPAGLAAAGVSFERYIVLSSLPVATLRILTVSVPEKVKRLYAALCTEIAGKERQWESHFDMEGDPERFSDMAQLATLQRFSAGSLNFAYERLPPLRMMLCISPFSLPSYLYRRIISMPFTKPAIGPHINFGRKHSLVLLRADYERSMWLIAKTIEMNPETSGINGWSWFFSRIVGEVYPHLAWMRDSLADGGAYLVDTFPADPGGYGFGYNNRKRQILYEQGKFCPRQTAYFWSRDDVLRWASEHPELATDGEIPVRAPQGHVSARVRSPKPAKHAKHNSSITLWNGPAALERMGQLKYIALTLLLPALALSLATFAAIGTWAAVLTFPVWLFLALCFQYLFSQ